MIRVFLAHSGAIVQWSTLAYAGLERLEHRDWDLVVYGLGPAHLRKRVRGREQQLLIQTVETGSIEFDVPQGALEHLERDGLRVRLGLVVVSVLWTRG